jgi:hypothetical protein
VPTKETKEQLIKRLEAMDAKHWNLYRIEKWKTKGHKTAMPEWYLSDRNNYLSQLKSSKEQSIMASQHYFLLKPIMTKLERILGNIEALRLLIVKKNQSI